MRAVVLLRTGLALALAAPLIWLGTALYLLSLEDYYPAPGSWLFYVGLSELVREAPVALAVGEPTYFGTVGDGGKLPHSEVSVLVGPDDREAASLSWRAHLQTAGFAPAVPQPRVQEPGQTVYVSPNGQHAVLGEWPQDDNVLVLLLRHFE